MSTERRRRWTRSEKERLVAVSFEPGHTASEVARTAGLHVSQLFRWRKRFGAAQGGPPPTPVSKATKPADDRDLARQAAESVGERRNVVAIEITFNGGQRIRVDADVDVEALRQIVDALQPR